MSAISLKSISGITSITTPAGVDNVFTVHTNDTTERFRIDQSGNQRVAGILTVTQNLDVGNNIKVGTGVTITPAGAGFYAGIITATSYRGDGSQLTGIIGVTINGNVDNRLVTATGTTGTLNGEANLLFDGGTLALNGRYQRGSATVQDGDAIAGGININGLDMDSSVIMSVFGNDNDFTRISGSKSRNASVGNHTIVQDNDVLLSLKGFGSDGTNFEEAAQIEMQVDGTPNNNVMPGRIVFKTTTTDGVVERLRITSSGNFRVTSGVIENSNTISSNYTVSSNYNAMSAGPMSIANGVSVTVPSGSAWTIV